MDQLPVGGILTCFHREAGLSAGQRGGCWVPIFSLVNAIPGHFWCMTFTINKAISLKNRRDLSDNSAEHFHFTHKATDPGHVGRRLVSATSLLAELGAPSRRLALQPVSPALSCCLLQSETRPAADSCVWERGSAQWRLHRRFSMNIGSFIH